MQEVGLLVAWTAVKRVASMVVGRVAKMADAKVVDSAGLRAEIKAEVMVVPLVLPLVAPLVDLLDR